RPCAEAARPRGGGGAAAPLAGPGRGPAAAARAGIQGSGPRRTRPGGGRRNVSFHCSRGETAPNVAGLKPPGGRREPDPHVPASAQVRTVPGPRTAVRVLV